MDKRLQIEALLLWLDLQPEGIRPILANAARQMARIGFSPSDILSILKGRD